MNKTILSGKIYQEINLKYVNGKEGKQFPVANGTIIVIRPFGGKNAKGYPVSDFFRIEATGKNAEQIGKLSNGNRVLLTGYFLNSEFTGRDGNKVRFTKFHIENIEFIDFPADQNQNSTPNHQTQNNPPVNRQNSSPQPSGMPAGQGAPNFTDEDFGGFDIPFDEDLPFN